ncbi:SitI3 family protein [Glycomyces sp. NRRL B-16210]|uniref:SitI3 family protein n=1 Tax=Glycomyces sp. NRRL B-16210 TaxID=1463821 RepID=UPI00106235AA|nr:SitI3 family protein [Glycomyces sp. NRRL B-16210]
MALEYDLEITPDIEPADLLDYFADLLHCDERFHEPGHPPRAFRREVILTALDWPPEDPSPLAELFDVSRTVSIGFRMNKHLNRRENRAVFRNMLVGSAQLLEDHPRMKAVFSRDEDDDIYLQRLGDEGIVLAAMLRDPYLNFEGVFDELLARYPVRDLGRFSDLMPDD